MKYFIFVLEKKILISNGTRSLPTNIVSNENITTLYYQEDIIGYNIFNVDTSRFNKGLIVRKDENLINFLNKTLDKVLDYDFADNIVVGKVLECLPHPDSDHLHVTTVEVADGEEHQIVCGAPNIAQGQKVVVALPGTLMPNGAQIWPGELRGVDSYGMICSARELGLPHAPQKRGIMVVPDSFEVGAEFEPTKCDELIASGEITL